MKNKKLISLAALLLAALILLSLAACGAVTVKPADTPRPTKRASQTAKPTETPIRETEAPPEQTEPETDTPAEPPRETAPEPTAQPEPAAADIAWSVYSEWSMDGDGYSLRTDLKISPWISENDPDTLAAAWKAVGRGKEFPSEQSLGFNGNYISNNGKTWIDYDEVFYAVGTFEVVNETEGWDITSENSLNISIYLYGANRYMTMQILYGNGTKNYYSVSNGVFGTQGGGWSPITGRMQSNHWGPVPFVLAFAVDKTPNHPDGDPSIYDCTFRFGGTAFTLTPPSDQEEPDEQDPGEPNGFSYLLTYAQPFSEGLAWVRYDEAAGTRTAVMDTAGDIRFILSEPAEYLSPFHENTAFYTVADTKTDVLIDSTGREIFRTQGSEDGTVKQERICGYANGVYILARQESGITEKTYKVALMDPDGTIRMEYTNSFTSLDMYASAVDLIDNLLFENTAYYRGAGWYQVGSTFIDFDQMRIGQIAYQTVVSDFLPSGELVTVDHVGMRTYDTDLNAHVNEVSIFPREMQDGAFFMNKYNFDTKQYEAGYYDEHLKLVLSVALYPDNQVYCSPFSEGLAVMEITGKDGKTYLTMIDTGGKQQFEPVIVEKYYPRVLDGYVIVRIDGELWLMDGSGALVHSMSGDFPGRSISIDGFSSFREGLLLLSYSYGGSRYYTYYPIKTAAVS